MAWGRALSCSLTFCVTSRGYIWVVLDTTSCLTFSTRNGSRTGGSSYTSSAYSRSSSRPNLSTSSLTIGGTFTFPSSFRTRELAPTKGGRYCGVSDLHIERPKSRLLDVGGSEMGTGRSRFGVEFSACTSTGRITTGRGGAFSIDVVLGRSKFKLLAFRVRVFRSVYPFG